MKKLPIIILMFVCSVCCASNPKDNTKNVVADVYYAELPAELEFAGERVPLEYPDVREALQREISVTMFMHSRSLLTLRAMERYFAIIEPILEKNGIPNDFKYLAMAESGLNPEAISHAGAGGLWQFMKGAAKEYGVETGDNVDLRFNVEIATVAATKYLKKSYARFNDWTLTAASYNIGQAGISRRMNTQMVDSYYDLFLPEETARYVYRILAMKIVSENPALYGFKLSDSDYQKPLKNYTIEKINSQNIKWSEFAKERGVNYKLLRALNPWIRSYEYANKPGVTYTVKVPNKNFRIKGY